MVIVIILEESLNDVMNPDMELCLQSFTKLKNLSYSLYIIIVFHNVVIRL